MSLLCGVKRAEFLPLVVGLDFGEIVREPRFVIGHWGGCERAFICGGMLHVFNCHD